MNEEVKDGFGFILQGEICTRPCGIRVRTGYTRSVSTCTWTSWFTLRYFHYLVSFRCNKAVPCLTSHVQASYHVHCECKAKVPGGGGGRHSSTLSVCRKKYRWMDNFGKLTINHYNLTKLTIFIFWFNIFSPEILFLTTFHSCTSLSISSDEALIKAHVMLLNLHNPGLNLAFIGLHCIKIDWWSLSYLHNLKRISFATLLTKLFFKRNRKL